MTINLNTAIKALLIAVASIGLMILVYKVNSGPVSLGSHDHTNDRYTHQGPARYNPDCICSWCDKQYEKRMEIHKSLYE